MTMNNAQRVLGGTSAAAALIALLLHALNGGRWDHVVPPPPTDPFGPGPRIPMMIFSPFCEGRGIDHTQYETVSILAFIEKIWGLPPLSGRDAHADPFTGAFNAAR